MIISVNWLKKFTTITLPVGDLATLIGARLVEIEEVIDMGAKYRQVVAARVIECAPLEGSDHLNLTKIDDGGVTPDIERDENGLVQVVCGAPNVRVGMMIAWLPPGAVVPETAGSNDEFVLGSRNLRGAMSHGMIASAKELALFDEHDGILVLDDSVYPGADFATAYELNDYLFDIENKSLTHRPDTFGIIGFAREVAAITGQIFVTPEWLVETNPVIDAVDDSLAAPTVTIDDPMLSARYQATVLMGADSTRQSPLMVQTYLARVGVRPINAVVDVTNYLMMLTGQPLHAFDYDKMIALSGGVADIHVRSARDGETLALLDGRIVTLAVEDIVISSGDVAVGLAGAMGGANTVIDADTKNIILESATFDLYRLRATQMRHGIFSEAITRFTKGQPAELTAPVLSNAVELLGEWAGATRVSGVAEAVGMSEVSPSIALSKDRMNAILGTDLSIERIDATLRRVECAVGVDGSHLLVAAPYWRQDMHIAEDIIEEVGRLNGFDSIPATLPARNFTAVLPTACDVLRSRIRQSLVRAGSNEVLTYSFVHGDVLTNATQAVTNSYRITNSISPDLQYYRQSLTPSIVGLVHGNVKQGFDHFALFECNTVHQKSAGLTDEGVPVEARSLALTIAHKNDQVGAAYYQAKKLLEFMAGSLGLTFVYDALPEDDHSAVTAPFEYRRSASVRDKTGRRIGIVGEYKKSVSKAFKLPQQTAGFELDLEVLLMATDDVDAAYRPSSRYPGSDRDVCFRVPADVTYGRVVASVQATLATVSLDTTISPVDIYQPSESMTKNITLRIGLSSLDHTLTGDEVTQVITTVSQAAGRDVSATIV